MQQHAGTSSHALTHLILSHFLVLSGSACSAECLFRHFRMNKKSSDWSVVIMESVMFVTVRYESKQRIVAMHAKLHKNESL